MAADRPISEHEGALFDAVRVLATAVLDLGADAGVLRRRLTEARDAAEALGNKHGAETLDFLIGSLFGVPDPSPKPSFRIV
ncbi:MAG TPA: hypothetical protein VGC27_01030 [Rhizomicrobium sp.]